MIRIVLPLFFSLLVFASWAVRCETATQPHAGSLKNPSFEERGGWKIVTRGDALRAKFDDDNSQAGQKSFTVSLPGETPTAKADFAGIVQILELARLDKGISFYVKDNYTGKTSRYHWMELLLDDEVIWESGEAYIASMKHEGSPQWHSGFG